MTAPSIADLRTRAVALRGLAGQVEPGRIGRSLDRGLSELGELTFDADALDDAGNAYGRTGDELNRVSVEVRTGAVDPLDAGWGGPAGLAASASISRQADSLEQSAQVQFAACTLLLSLGERHRWSRGDHGQARQRLVDLRNGAGPTPFGGDALEHPLLVEPAAEALREAAEVLDTVADNEETAAGHFADDLATVLAVQIRGQNPLSIEPAANRRPLDDILANYQVSEDPGGTVLFPEDPVRLAALRAAGLDPVPMTRSEADLYNQLSTPALLNSWRIQGDAEARALDTFGRPGQTDGHTDAFRHIYWNARLTQEFGADWTADATTAHERHGENFAHSEAMDLHNNELGRRIGLENPDASPDQLALLITAAVTHGDAVVIGADNEIAYSDQVAYDQTGDGTTIDDPPGTDPSAPGDDRYPGGYFPR